MTLRKTYPVYICLCGLLGLVGCGDIFEKTPTELESKSVIRDISRVRENPHVGNPLPGIYTQPPKRLHVEDGIKLFYFTHYLPSGDLSYSHKDKALEKRMHGFAGTIRDMGFKVSANPSTNQLIIHCADDAECDQVLAYLEKTDVPPIQVHIDCLILERFGDVTKDWETTLLIENFLGETVTLGEAKYPAPAFPGAALRETRRRDFGLDIGYWMNKGVPGHQVRTMVDLLESRGYLKILMNPTLETVNGKTAEVRILDRAPLELTVTERNTTPYSVTTYQNVSDVLKVTPYVYSDGSIGLETNIILGSKSKPEGVVQTSIITERSIDVEENRIEPGKSLIIGGMRKAENRSVIRGVPFFKDLPLIGILFSSKDFEENATEITFILTPSISSGGVDYKTMSDTVREKFETSDFGGDLDAMVTDPMGEKVYSQVVGKQGDEAEAERIRLQVQTAELQRQAQADRLRAEQAILESRRLKAKAEQAEAQIETAAAEKNAAEAAAKAAAKEAEVRQAALNQSQAELEEAIRQASQAAADAQKAHLQFEQAQAKTNTLAEEVEQTRQEAEKIQKQIDRLQQSAPVNPEPTEPSTNQP